MALTVLQNGNLVSGSQQGTIKIWNPTSGVLIPNGHTGRITALTVLPNGNLVSGSDDKTIKIWNPTTGALIQTLFGHLSIVYALTVLQNGNLVSALDDSTIKIWGIDDEGTLNVYLFIGLLLFFEQLAYKNLKK